MATALQGLSEGGPNARQPSVQTQTQTQTLADYENMAQPKLSITAKGDEEAVSQGGFQAGSLPQHQLPSPSPEPEPTTVTFTTDDKQPASRPEKHLPGVRRLSATKMAELTESLPISAIPDVLDSDLATRGRVRDRSKGRDWDRLCRSDGVVIGSGFSPPLDGRRSAGSAGNDIFNTAVHDADIDEPAPPLHSLDGAPRVQRHWNSTGSLRTLSVSTPPTIGGRRRSSGNSQPAVVPAPFSASASASTSVPMITIPGPSSSSLPTPSILSAPPVASNTSTRRQSQNSLPRPPPLHIDSGAGTTTAAMPPPRQQKDSVPVDRLPSPIAPSSIPLPPMSLPTLLQLELAGQRPSPLYIHHSHAADLPYESNAVKFERLKNFLLLPTYLERTIYFGALACLDAWLWTLTILPIRFFIALGVLVRWWGYIMWKEARFMTAYVWRGLGRMWKRGRVRRPSSAGPPPNTSQTQAQGQSTGRPRGRSNGSSTSGSVPPMPATTAARRQASPVPPALAPRRQASSHHGQNGKMSSWGHRRTKSMPSNLTSFHKADLLQGAVIVCSALALMNLDASRMYHFIRAQSAVKLYVIYNLVEVGDRLLSALGQDVFECLFSAETLSRTASGRSKLLLPFGMFCLGLAYNIAHSIVLFYQVITLNVAVNSYSNALLSLLMSNQFVEVKSSVFKRTEKENTFQLACADIVERFQLWIVLFIIAMRNIVEIGGLSVPGSIDLGEELVSSANKVPLHNSSILPASFTILPSWLVSVEVLSPFLIVIGSEMVVDWIKHGYINKFNNIKPQFYSRVLDILCKDYYTNAFMAPALMRRLGLPLIPLCTLFLRSSIQTYHMFLATHLPSPSLPSTHTSLATAMGGPSAAEPSSPAMAASLERLDLLIRNALGRSVHGNPYSSSEAVSALASWWAWSSDDMIASVTMVVVFFIVFLILLIARMLLSMALLRYARNRYAAMKAREHAEAHGKAEPESYEAAGKRTGGYGKIEVGEERRRWIFHDDPEGLKKQREKERKGGGGTKEVDLSKITRYEMVAKRIW
ncbi:transmembrane anterior posterior transformation 1 [Ophiostoma piceae UAMH 11346]|uniref:Transmembrane anterior posterior transformation 1 n=1 Tax=Ophiostoma piceae (strain UAMH 11346) TaxID=1262450 RepID=S3CNK7_OPHP1|nr:transmembrane anterior posterior transformation 1 [Ophiostoma piceae UAMH 11346]